MPPRTDDAAPTLPPTETVPDATTAPARDAPPVGDEAVDGVAERAWRHGVDRLAADGLVALVAGRGGAAGAARASTLVARMGGLRRAATASADEWRVRGGVAPRTALRLAAAFALGRRALDRPWRRGDAFRSPADVFERYHAALRDLRKERFVCLMLDAKNRVLREEVVSEGGLVSTPVHPREAFGPAVREGAHGVLFLHNHPSGDPEPSDVDVDLTRRLVASGELLGITVRDHIVVAEHGYVSFLERGLLPG